MEVEFEDYYLDFPDDAQDDEIVSFLSDLGDSISTYFMGEPVQPPVYSDVGGSFQQVREQAPLVTEEATRSWEPYITGGAARDFVVGSEFLARNLAGQRIDAPEDIAGAMAATGVTGAATQFPAKTTPGTLRSWIGIKDAGLKAKHAQKKARDLDAQGKSKEEIYDETGWWKDEEGNWLTEQFNTDFFKSKDTAVDKLFERAVPGEEITVKGKDVFPKGTPAYRTFKNAEITLKYDPSLESSEGYIRASANADKTKIYMAGSAVNNMKSALLHETGHGWQKRMGGTAGTSPSYFYDPHVSVKDLSDKNFFKGLSNQVMYNWNSKLDPIENLKLLKAKSYSWLERQGANPEEGKAKEVLQKIDKEIDSLGNIKESAPVRYMRYHENYGEANARSQATRENKEFIGRPQKQYPWEETDADNIHFDAEDVGASEVYDRNYAEWVEAKKKDKKARMRPILPESYGSVFD